MSWLRFSPILLLAVADVLPPGGCCQGSSHAYHGPVRRPSLSISNRSTVDICAIEWFAGDGGAPRPLSDGEASGAAAPPLKPATSREWPLPADRFTVRLLDCEGKELAKKEVEAHGGPVDLEYP